MEGRITRYDLRYSATALTEADWNSAVSLETVPAPRSAGDPETLRVSGLPQMNLWFALKAADEVPNWSALSNVASTLGDTVAPGRVTDLAVISATAGEVILTWTAPGDDGAVGRAAGYDIRYSGAPLTEATWTSATVVSSSAVPRTGGEPETLTVAGLDAANWQFALKAVDEKDNWSAMSNVAEATREDVEAPSAVRDLSVSSTTAHDATLVWTAPGDDGEAGQAAEYDLRYAEAPITGESWTSAARAEGTPVPGASGSQETFTVTGLQPTKTYYFALRTADDVPNWSDLSNGISSGVLGLTRLTTSPPSAMAGCSWPSWSRDGSRIAFSADWSGNSDIYTIPAGGGTADRIVTRPLPNYSPSWSPDGMRIAFRSVTATVSQLWIVDLSSPDYAISQLTHQPDGVYESAWSPDGARIAFAAGTGMWSPVSGIFFIAPEGGSVDTLFTHASGNFEPAWSPDGTQIAFVSSRTGDNEIFVIPASGGDAVRLTFTAGGSVTPCWSPDGTRIAFASEGGGNPDIWIMPVAGGASTQVTTDPSRDSCPTWSPDASRIAFSSRRTGKWEIWVQEIE